jgi:hypothetical protein
MDVLVDMVDPSHGNEVVFAVGSIALCQLDLVLARCGLSSSRIWQFHLRGRAQVSFAFLRRQTALDGPDDVDNLLLSLSETLSGWRLTENRAMLLFNEGSFQAHWLGGCRSIAVAGSARGRDLDIAAANKRSAADCS